MEYYDKRDYLEEVQEVGVSKIEEFFDSTSVFITGASGLVGKVVLEKLLRSCPRIKTIFILLREKKGINTKVRFQSFLDDKLFFTLRRQDPKFERKIKVIPGDISQPGLGISQEDVETLIKEVDVVIHAAAYLSMKGHLRDAFRNNVMATWELLETAEKMPKLKAFIYISTAYAQPYKEGLIEEKFFDPGINVFDIKRLLNSDLDDFQIASLTPKLLGNFENTYSLTKSLSESVVRSFIGKLPVAIVRPSIVVGCAKEPLVGWLSNIFGANGVSLGAYIGFLSVWYCEPNALADLIPVDYVANTVLAAAWDAGTNKRVQPTDEDPIYHIVSGNKAPMTWDNFFNINRLQGLKEAIPSTKMVGLYNFQITKNKLYYYIRLFWYCIIPSVFIDLALQITDRKPRLLNAYIKVHNANIIITGYCCQTWEFSQHNLDTLLSKMNNQDKQKFYFDMDNFNWKGFYVYGIRMLRILIMHDPLDTIEESRQMYYRRRRIVNTVKGCVYCMASWLLFNYLKSTQLAQYFSYEVTS